MDGDFVPSPKNLAADSVGNVNFLVFCSVNDMGRIEVEARIVLRHERLAPNRLFKVTCGANAARNNRVRKNLRPPRWGELRWPFGFRKCLVVRNLRSARNGRERGHWEAIRG